MAPQHDAQELEDKMPAIPDYVRNGIVWVLAGALSAAGGTLIVNSRDDAIHTQQIGAIQQSQRSLATQVSALTSDVTSLTVSVAALTQQMADQRVQQALQTQLIRRYARRK